jgi:hypothetical protein
MLEHDALTAPLDNPRRPQAAGIVAGRDELHAGLADPGGEQVV